MKNRDLSFLSNKKVAVLMGGWSAEREISLKSGNAVLKSLTEMQINAKAIDLVSPEESKLQLEGFDIAFIALHGRGGEDGFIQDLLTDKIRKKLVNAKEQTSNNKGLNLNLAISYGSKQEIIEAVKSISSKVKKNIISLENIDENIINDHLYTRNLDNVDLLIRTGGEIRVSNFLLWQISYAELVFLELLWPDFKKRHFYEAIVEYQKRARRFGKI